ncbi:MAG: FHA domain-containing protein [Lachnospiraceae bacterium]
MEGKRWGLTTFTAAGLLFLMCMTIFLPGLKISADKYIDSAVIANQYALERDSGLESAKKVVEDYRVGGTMRSETEKTYNRRISELTGNDDSISRLFLARWVIRVKASLDFEGIELAENRSLTNTDIYFGLRLWGWFIYLPFLMNLITLVFVLCKGRPFKGVLLADGIITMICECVCHFAVPSMLWSGGYYVVKSFSLVGEDAIRISGVGAKFIKSLLNKCGGISWIIVIVLALLLIIYSTVTLILSSVKSKKPEKGKSHTGTVTGLSEVPPEVWNQGGGKKTETRMMGEICGIQGEYAGQHIMINFGEEIVFGRDARYCMLIFKNPRVSRRHCGIRYDTDRGCYQVIDYSSGGTKLEDGSLLAASEYTMLSPGTMIYMANGTEVFMLM